ncbi:MAG: transcriptional regulator [Haloplasmataceae bacterium]|jgi:nitrogen regulatory protein PII|nr:transcriptional regulator [Haloplasmataceae bacterium]
MNNHSEIKNYNLICVVVDFGKGSKVIKTAKLNGITGATIILGRGTVNNHILKILDLTDVRKEIVLMASDKEVTKGALEALNEKFQFERPHHGIAFTFSLLNFLGHCDCVYNNTNESRGLKTNMYNAIFVVVDKGRAEDVLESAVSAGSRGGTIINGRGSGIHEHKMLFAIPIEPEKEVVMILADSKTTEGIVAKVRADLKIDEPGMGILFTLAVDQTFGLY